MPWRQKWEGGGGGGGQEYIPLSPNIGAGWWWIVNATPRPIHPLPSGKNGPGRRNSIPVTNRKMQSCSPWKPFVNFWKPQNYIFKIKTPRLQKELTVRSLSKRKPQAQKKKRTCAPKENTVEAARSREQRCKYRRQSDFYTGNSDGNYGTEK